MHFTYLQVPLHRMTFSQPKIYKWVASHCEGRVLNLFAGATKFRGFEETRNDKRHSMPADYHMDALDFVKQWKGQKFHTVILDPPYSYRKSMEMYDGVKCSPFNALKNELLRILKPSSRVITFGYHSVVMGKKRGFTQEAILLMSHGGAIHDTIAVVEHRRQLL